MAGVAFDIKIDADDAVAGLRNVARRVARSRELTEQWASILEGGARARIETDKRDPEGKAWAPWSAAYARRRGGRGGLLRQSDHLLDSIESRADREGAEVGTNEVYARVHQLGHGDRNIPERGFLGISEDERKEIEDAGRDWLANVVRS